MARFAPDQFDDIPDDGARVGAHRGPAKKGAGLIRFLWGLLAVVVLVIGGLYGLSRLNPDIDFSLPIIGGSDQTDAPIPTDSSTPPATPITDPHDVPKGLKVTISVLNASGTKGLQTGAASLIHKAGWPSPATPVAASTYPVTTVYYTTADYEGVARGIALLLGDDVPVTLSDAYLGAPITVVIGQDYTPPAPAPTATN